MRILLRLWLEGEGEVGLALIWQEERALFHLLQLWVRSLVVVEAEVAFHPAWGVLAFRSAWEVLAFRPVGEDSFHSQPKQVFQFQLQQEL